MMAFAIERVAWIQTLGYLALLLKLCFEVAQDISLAQQGFLLTFHP